MRRPPLALAYGLAAMAGLAPAAEAPLPRVAPGWKIERVVEAPDIAYPTAIVAAPDGTIYLGQDPMDMPGPPTVPADSVVAIKDGKVREFADKLWAVMGLEWADDTLYVVHAPFLSALRDTDGDGRADHRVDLMTGLGPDQPGFNGINDHVASGLRLGMDGFLYIAVGDKGIPRGKGADGRTIQLKGGGVIRIRPDGTDLEVVSSGERNPLSVALTAQDDVFTYGNDDDSKKWPNSLTHHIVGGHYGYPYEFLSAPDRALPIVAGQLGGSGTQGICYNDDGLPERYRGGLFFCDWGTQTVTHYRIAREGASFKVLAKEKVVEKGDLGDFRPFSLAASPDGMSFYLVDWAYGGWLAKGPATGRLFRLAYDGADRVTPAPRPTGTDLAARLAALDHPAFSARLDAQRRIVDELGPPSVAELAAKLGGAGPIAGRIHALWALDAIPGGESTGAIRSVLDDPDAEVRLQAIRSRGIRRDAQARSAIATHLGDADPAVRREAAIALGRIADPASLPALYAGLGELDPFAAWSIRQAIRSIGVWADSPLVAALGDPRRREEALKLADQTWAVPVAVALAAIVTDEGDPEWRARVVATLAGLYRRYPEWDGQWFGTNPLASPPPRRTEDWDAEGMAAVFEGLAAALEDEDPSVRRPALVGLLAVGPRALPLFRRRLPSEDDPRLLSAIVEALGLMGDAGSAPTLAKLLADPDRPLDVRTAALDALGNLNARPALNARMMLVYDPKAPAELLARALPKLGMSRRLPPNDLAGFLDHPSELVRAAAVAAFPLDSKPLPEEVHAAIAARLDDPAAPVRRAAAIASARHRIDAAVRRLVVLADKDEAVRDEATMALCNLPDARAIPAYVAAIQGKNPDLRRAGESALLAIRDQARPDIAARAARGEFAGPSALAAERILARFAPVVDWKVIGPFPRTLGPLFPDPAAIDFGRPESGAEGRSVAWSDRRADPVTGQVVLEDLKGGAGDRGGFGYDAQNPPQISAFAVAEIASDRDRSALLLVGSSGTIQLTLDGKPVLSVQNYAGRPYAPDSDLVRVALKKGSNRLLVRSHQGMGVWAFGVQVSEDDGSAGSAAPAVPIAEALRSYALGHDGDPKKGEALFFDARGIGCVKCHSVGGRGGANVGPDLAGLAGKYDRAEVIRSVLEPSNRIATGYQPVLIARKDGTLAAGVLRAESDAEVELVDAEARPIRIRKDQIDERKLGEVSIMPAGQVDGLTPAEFADLVAYLMSLRP
ncbi:HEAT repeat domain-containing protein [Tundrisphaera sp. TA3]|uniref:HEAT repeat domain-containing protein n=1 Tax=Tundrisphaera sp. TA3 TaxID=3435775 RepID=UPI003EB71C5C